VQGVSERTESADRILLLRLNLGISRAPSEKTGRQWKELVSQNGRGWKGPLWVT